MIKEGHCPPPSPVITGGKENEKPTYPQVALLASFAFSVV